MEPPNKVWITDLTYIRTDERRLYLPLFMAYHGHFLTRAQAQAAIFECIEASYNRQRRNAAIGDLPPAEFRRRFYQQQAA